MAVKSKCICRITFGSRDSFTVNFVLEGLHLTEYGLEPSSQGFVSYTLKYKILNTIITIKYYVLERALQTLQ